jgi:hypothetical protein
MKVLRHVAGATFITVAFTASQFVRAQIPPSITTQPQSQTVAFESDVVFTVNTTGTGPLTYQWCNQAGNLADYDNMAGTQTPSFNLVGVGQQNAGSYYVIITNAAGSVTSSVVSLTVNSRVVLQDSFENGLGQWTPLMDALPLVIDGTENHTTNGAFSAMITNTAQGIYSRLNPRESGRVRMTFWLYDNGNAQSAYGELRGYTGASGYARYVPPKGLRQCLAIGINTLDFGTKSKGDFVDETPDPTKYQARVMSGPNSGWFNLNGTGAPSRSPGWHEFQIDRYRSSATVNSNIDDVDFYVNGVLAQEVLNIKTADLDTVTIGSTGLGESNQWPIVSTTAWFDDVMVEAFEKSYDYQTLGSNGPIPELMQLRETGTNAAVVNVSPTTVNELTGASTNNGLGFWAVTNSEVYAQGVRGYLDYVVAAPADNAYRVEIEGHEKDYKWPQVDIRLDISFDGIWVGRFVLPYGASSNGLVHFFTPYILAGSHTVEIYWDNAQPHCSLAIDAVRLQSLTGGSMFQGMHMWVANRLRAQNGMDSPPSASLVSPVCLEGRGGYFSMMNLVAGTNYPLSPITVHPGAGSRWYANVPLSPGNGTIMQVSYQNGGLTETNEIVWQVMNLLDASNVVIRQGDSLLLDAFPEGATNGEVAIEVGDQTPISSDASIPVPYQFTAAGTYTVTGLYGPTGASGSIIVTVMAASFSGPLPVRLATWSSLWTYWDCTNLPPGVVVDSDPLLEFSEVSAADRQQWLTNAPPLGTNERVFRVQTRSTAPKHVLARLGTNGPILADTTILGFRLFAPPISSFRVVANQDDGSQIIEATFIQSPIVAGVSVNLQVAKAGLTFDDGTLMRTLTQTNFDELGICRVNLIRAAGVQGSACMVLNVHRDAEGGNE